MDFMIFDSHTHIGHSKFDKDREEAIKRAFDLSINIIEVGNDNQSSQKAVELAKKYADKIWATVGCHPHYIEEFNYDFYKNLAQEKEVVAIGECGLDYYYNLQPTTNNQQLTNNNQQREKQKEVFIKHIELANEVGKPLMIHCRQAFKDLIEIYNNYNSYNNYNILHFFTGTFENAKQLLEMGFYFTFNGLITFNRDFDEIIKFIPSDRILLETDAPYVAPVPYRGKRNEPSYVVEVAKKVAEIKNVSLEEICEQTAKNAERVFNLL